jgi:hypothetical protein
VSYWKLADAFRNTGEKAKALDALQQGRAITVRMTSLSPDNAAWTRDLAWFDGADCGDGAVTRVECVVVRAESLVALESAGRQ